MWGAWYYYLNLAQINDNLRWCKEPLECRAQTLRQWRHLVKHNPAEVPMPIPLHTSTDMPDIAHQTQQAIAPELVQMRRQPAACPDQHVMRQHIQQHHHLLRLEALLVPFGDPQALLVVFDRGLDPTAAPVIEIDVGQQHRPV